MPRLVENCVVVGTGLIGASFAGALRVSGVVGRVCGIGRGSANLGEALTAGLVDEVSTELGPSLSSADFVLLAVPVDTALELLPTVASLIPDRCVVSDVGSVKSPIVERAEKLGVGARFVGGHPLAGSEQSGAGAACVDLFKNKATVLTPSKTTDQSATELVAGLWKAAGARVFEMEAGEHDRLLALSSHLPQMLAFNLAATTDDVGSSTEFSAVAGRGFSDMTRLALSDQDMWAGVMRLNRSNLLAAMDAFSLHWTRLRDAIESSDEKMQHEIMSRARRQRRRLDR
ncbi:MAG: prephenate dehydrogenase [Candidatus Binatia bacterium]